MDKCSKVVPTHVSNEWVNSMERRLKDRGEKVNRADLELLIHDVLVTAPQPPVKEAA